MTPKISIVFTSYNHREFLTEALYSIINQTFKEFELIIIDDCSTDGSQDILIKYKEDPRIKLFFLEENTGSYVHSSNLGASIAIADYIIFAQCDDFSEVTQLEKLYAAMINNPQVGVAYSSSILVDQNSKYINCDFNIRERKFKKQCSKNTIISGLKMREYLLYSCVIPNLSAALIKRTLFVKLKGLSSKYFVLADWDFWLRMTIECDFYYIREPLNNFRQHNSTIRNSIKLKRQIIELFEMYYSFFDLTKLGIKKRIYYEFSIAHIWMLYFKIAKLAWLKSFLSLQLIVIKRSLRFPVIFLILIFAYPLLNIRRRLLRITLH